MATKSIISNEGTFDSASAVLKVSATNPDYNQPALRIKQAGKHSGTASIRINAPNPDIELTETDQVATAASGNIGLRTCNQFGGGKGVIGIASALHRPIRKSRQWRNLIRRRSTRISQLKWNGNNDCTRLSEMPLK